MILTGGLEKVDFFFRFINVDLIAVMKVKPHLAVKGKDHGFFTFPAHLYADDGAVGYDDRPIGEGEGTDGCQYKCFNGGLQDGAPRREVVGGGPGGGGDNEAVGPECGHKNIIDGHIKIDDPGKCTFVDHHII